MIPSPSSPTHAEPRITAARFVELLKTKNSPAVPEGAAVFDILVQEGVDPSFALAQFRVESQYGTAGWAKITGSWGNMLYDRNLCTHASGFYRASNGYTYATYNSYHDAIRDYCNYIHWYRDEHNLESIYEATGRWLGLSRTGDPGHISYVNIIVDDMIKAEYRPTDFYEVGDEMILSEGYIDDATGRPLKRYPITDGTPLYRGTDGSLLKYYDGPTGNALFFGPVVADWKDGKAPWGAVRIFVNGVSRIVYIKNLTKTKEVAA